MLCIISYQLQAHLDLVPHRSLDQLRAQFSTLSPDADDHIDAQQHAVSTANASVALGAFPDSSRAATSVTNVQKQEQHDAVTATVSTYTHPVIVKTEPLASPPLSMRQPHPQLHSHLPRRSYSPESSPEVALMDSVRSTYSGITSYYDNSSRDDYQPHHEQQRERHPWPAKVHESEDEPMSPVLRPARSNIMSISALMSGPSPVRPRSPTPELIQTPPRPVESLPMLTQEWTEDDEMASRFLQACADSIPKIDTTELDRLTQIAQLAAFDLEMLSAPSSPHESTPSLATPTTDQQRHFSNAQLEPQKLNPLDTLDTQMLYDREEAEYIDEMEANDELYKTVRYLARFDEVVDEWRAGELARLRLQLEMRKAEIARIWTCDRKLIWSTFVDNRAGELYRKQMVKASHARWQAELELDLLEVHRRKTRGVAKLTKDIWLPRHGTPEVQEAAAIYKRFGQFVSAAKYPDRDDPLVRADVRKMRIALRAHKSRSQEARMVVNRQVGEVGKVVADRDDAVLDAQLNDVSCRSESSSDAGDGSDGEEYSSDSSYVSSTSGISSLPSFSSLYSSPDARSVAD